MFALLTLSIIISSIPPKKTPTGTNQDAITNSSTGV